MKKLFLIAGMLMCGALSAAASTVTYDIAIDTAPLIGHPAGPFTLDFQFTDGSGTGDANNTVTLSDFNFGGGSAVGAPGLTGGASGDTSSGLSLTDSSFFNEVTQGFDPGSTLKFTFTETGNVEPGGTPDEFSFAILDSSFADLPSTSPEGVMLVSDITSASPAVLSYGTDATQSPAAGGPPIDIAAPTVATPAPPVTTPVPEPANFWLAATGLSLLCMLKTMQRLARHDSRSKI
jgi:hypothetical protein